MMKSEVFMGPQQAPQAVELCSLSECRWLYSVHFLPGRQVGPAEAVHR